MNVPLKLPLASVRALAVVVKLPLQAATNVRNSRLTVDPTGGGVPVGTESTFPEKLTLVWPDDSGEAMAFNVVAVLMVVA